MSQVSDIEHKVDEQAISNHLREAVNRYSNECGSLKLFSIWLGLVDTDENRIRQANQLPINIAEDRTLSEVVRFLDRFSPTAWLAFDMNEGFILRFDNVETAAMARLAL